MSVASEIYKGEHDDELSDISRACQHRQRVQVATFKPGDRVRIVGAGGRIEGCMATVVRPNQKTVTIQVDDGGGWRVSPKLLEIVS